MSKLILIGLALVFLAACEKPIAEAAIGDTVINFVVRDLETGKCVRVRGTGKYNTAAVVECPTSPQAERP